MTRQSCSALDRSSGSRPNLGERIEIRASDVHGRGVFARRRLRKGQRIGLFEGVPTQMDGMHVLWVIEEDGTEIGIEGRNDLRFLNHDPMPNAEFRGAELFATRNVQPGSEILIDYGEGWRNVGPGETQSE